MTSMPAEHFGIKRRGRIAASYYADLVLIDPKEIADQATYAAPSKPSLGIKWVFINGEPVIRDGQPTNQKPGLFLGLKGSDPL